ncbi:MAG: hypothetical protein ACJ72D_24350 [Marmoricola sp.]
MRPIPVKSFAILASLLLATTLTACGGSDPEHKAGTSVPPTGQPTGMLQGTLQMVGGMSGATPEPVPGTITIAGPGGSVTKTEVDASGRFAIGLFPGSYRVRGTSPKFNESKGTCRTSEASTKLTAGATVTIEVDCQRK